jgi:sacsin
MEKTGRYGIGFNSVYHLTDCPSFLSNDDTLVIFDPHRRYVLDEDPGKLINLTADRRNLITDTLSGYLGKHFNLKDSTMFRFPLRRKGNISEISNSVPDMGELMQAFQKEARQSLLFLNHVKQITLSKIDLNNKLVEIYQVNTMITPEDEKKRQDMARRVSKLSGTPTAEIGLEGVSYTMKIEERKKEVEKWLIQKCVGSMITTKKPVDEIPDGRELGLLPRGGLAARLWSKRHAFRGMVYCFLPLPENYTNLPVHINGHFALDNSRRGLWTDTDGKGSKCKWNHFIKTCVLPPAYAALIMEARNHLCNGDHDNNFSRYHGLFPSVHNSPWKSLALELYRYLGQTRAKVLPLLIPTKSENEESAQNLVDEPITHDMKEPDTSVPQPVLLTCTQWLSTDQTFFRRPYEKDSFLHLLIRIGMPVLLCAPHRIHDDFKTAGVSAREVSPPSVINFLREFESEGSTCKISQLPKNLEMTVINSVPELSALTEYCYEDDDFSNNLEGMPLLLTQDGNLRVFDSREPVFRSEFGALFPTQLHLFVHSKIIRVIPGNATRSNENVVREFTVGDLASLLPSVFTDLVLLSIEYDSSWKFPAEGILSEKWFKSFWDLLQNHVKPEPKKYYITLECLSKWPILPTTCGKLVTIEDARSVLDMTPTGTESTAQENVRIFLTHLECPVLNKKITFGSESSSSVSRAVTKRYVAHPYNVADVLVVLDYLMNSNNLDLSKVDGDEIRDFLMFVQDNYERSEDLDQCKRIIKNLPLHKTLSGQFVSLTDHHSSCALIPSSVPIQHLDELQERAKCVFLNSDALPTLAKLYKDLGVRAGQNVAQFYVEYVLQHFDVFTRDSQMNHLIYIKDNVYSSFPQGRTTEKEMFM